MLVGHIQTRMRTGFLCDLFIQNSMHCIMAAIPKVWASVHWWAAKVLQVGRERSFTISK